MNTELLVTVIQSGGILVIVLAFVIDRHLTSVKLVVRIEHLVKDVAYIKGWLRSEFGGRDEITGENTPGNLYRFRNDMRTDVERCLRGVKIVAAKVGVDINGGDWPPDKPEYK